MLWVVLQSIATRGVGMLQQLLLAWLLLEDDFGLIALTYTVSTFVNLLSNPGIDTVLIQRHRRFRQWATPAFWLGLLMGLVGMVVMAIVAPVAAWAYGRPQLTGLILVMAIAAPLQTLQIVPRSKLQGELRFRTVATLAMLNNIVTAVLTVALAYFKFGAYSFAIPVPIVAALTAAATWFVSRPHIHRDVQFRRWKYLLEDSAAMGGTQLVQTGSAQGDYLCLGLTGVSDTSIGVYYFAFRLSTQSFSLIASAVHVVLFPSLSQLVLDPGLQLRAAMRASRLLALVAIPFCLLQILLAGPAIRLVCPPRWLDAIVPLQILTVGIMANAPGWPASSLMMAQRKFRELLRVSAICTAVFFVAVVGALSIEKSIISVAIAVTLWYLWATPYFYWAAMRPNVRYYGYLAAIYRPLLAGLVPFVMCVFWVPQFPAGKLGDAAALVTVTTFFCLVYLLLLCRFAKRDFNDLIAQIQPILHQLRAWSAT